MSMHHAADARYVKQLLLCITEIMRYNQSYIRCVRAELDLKASAKSDAASSEILFCINLKNKHIK